MPAETPPPLRCSLSTDQASASHTVILQWHARSPLHPLRGSPRAPTTHKIGWYQHAAPVLHGRTTPTTTPPQEQATGLGHATPMGTTLYSQHMYCPCLPFNYKRRGLGPLRGDEQRRTPCNTHTRIHIPAA
jgi:hypothetical protein